MKLTLILLILLYSSTAFGSVGACDTFISESKDIKYLDVEGLCLIDEVTPLDDLVFENRTLRYSIDLKLFFTVIISEEKRAALLPNDILYVLEPGNEFGLLDVFGIVRDLFTGTVVDRGHLPPEYKKQQDELKEEKAKNDRLRAENRRLREENNEHTGSDSDPTIEEIKAEYGTDTIGVPVETREPTGEMMGLINHPDPTKNMLGVKMLIKAYRRQNKKLRKLNRYSIGRSIKWRPQGSNRIVSHTSMNEGEYLQSSNGRFKFVLQGNGNLVLYSGKKALWSSKTSGKGKYPFKLIMQNDGNLVIYGMGKAVWSTRTHKKGRRPYRLIMQADRNVVLYDSLGKALWSTNTWIR